MSQAATPGQLLQALDARDAALTAQHAQLLRRLPPSLSERRRLQLWRLARGYAAADRAVARARATLAPFARLPMPAPPYMRADAAAAFAALRSQQQATARFEAETAAG